MTEPNAGSTRGRRRRGVLILALVLLQAALMAGTLPIEDFGVPGWQHLGSLAVALLLVAPFWRQLQRSRAFLGIGVLATTILAVGSGFFILYWKPWLKAHVLVDWIKFWHVFWSWLGIVFFVFHTWINRVALGHFWRAVHRSGFASSVLYGVLAVLVLVCAYTWTEWGKDAIGDPNYIPLTWYAWILLVGPSYGTWIGALLGRTHESMAWITQALPRLTVRGFVDVALIPATILANLSGFPITFWKDEIHGNGLKFAGKVTHTAPSIVMAILIFIHIVQLWGPTSVHWRTWERRWSRAPT